ncbi:unnamed protein product [Clonostachys rosea]|uniref:Uncharacterized protein n=1 Tax=Bionectria ochroleuca TaxID=29856 RepID=A0ABY6V2Z2_BIOOC|nr:unnamed protein product [Clonostachys rosea]
MQVPNLGIDDHLIEPRIGASECIRPYSNVDQRDFAIVNQLTLPNSAACLKTQPPESPGSIRSWAAAGLESKAFSPHPEKWTPKSS